MDYYILCTHLLLPHFGECPHCVMVIQLLCSYVKGTYHEQSGPKNHSAAFGPKCGGWNYHYMLQAVKEELKTFGIILRESPIEDILLNDQKVHIFQYER